MRKNVFLQRLSYIMATVAFFTMLVVGCADNGGDKGADGIVFLPCGIADMTVAPACVMSDETADSVSLDPLAAYQWHLKNTGQFNFANSGGTTGADLNMMKAVSAGCGGKGVLVAVVDSGLEIGHEDLRDNAPENCSYDMANRDADPTPSGSGGDHGTSVAGLIAAAMNNGKGGRGVAPQAWLKGFNLLDYRVAAGAANEILALGGSNGGIPGFISNDVHIFNMSYGANPVKDTPVNADIESHLAFGTSGLRGGKGAIYVKAGGNEFSGLNSDSGDAQNACAITNSLGLGCYNANMEPVQTIPYLIIVGALNADGVKASYSNTGSALWISAPGGEFGESKPAMLTTDLSGCDRGYTQYGSNPIEYHTAGLNPDCKYTHSFNGSSSAAPALAGVVALMLEANPNLTWRDVKHILARTARQVDEDRSADIVATNGNYNALPSWTTNQGGFHYHNWYGFGAADVDAALTEIKDYTAGSLGTFQALDWKKTTDDLSLAIPDYDADGTSDTINISDVSADFVVEEVQIQVNITHNYTGDLSVELTSPHGTRSVLLNAGSRLQNDADLDNMQLLSNAFYGETTVNGAWILKVVDASNEGSGTLNSWRIRFWGHVRQ